VTEKGQDTKDIFKRPAAPYIHSGEKRRTQSLKAVRKTSGSWSAPVSLKAKIFKIIYRLTLPGGLLLIFAAVLIRVGILSDPDSPMVRYVPLVIFAIGLGLSGFFRRSRLLFATLVLALSEAAFIWVAPFMSVTAAHTMVTAFSLLLPLNLVAIAFIKERGTICRTG
jgi:hypothetical protein